jgi:hypothetical protein
MGDTCAPAAEADENDMKPISDPFKMGALHSNS